MTTTLQTGHTKWSLVRDEAGYREYKVTHKVRGAYTDGPYNVLLTPGLPLPGSMWNFFSDTDPFVWCRANAVIDAVQIDSERTTLWTVEQIFSNKPGDSKRCQDVAIEDPLLEPQKVSGSFTRSAEVAVQDMWGDPLLNSAHEMLLGETVTFDVFRPTVRIEQNVPLLQLSTVAAMVGTVNIGPMWGLPARSILMVGFSWEKRYYGACNVYYTRIFDFEINTKNDPNTGIAFTAWDRDLVDEGSKVLNGHWSAPVECEQGSWILDDVCGEAPDPDNPAHFCRFKDRNGENCRVVLDGNGLPAEINVVVREVGQTPELGTGTQVFGKISAGETHVTNIGKIHVQVYKESNFITLGIPLTF